MEEALFIPLATLLQWCDEQNNGDRETFGIFEPGEGTHFPNWPIGAPADCELEFSVQDFVDYSEEKHPGYPLEKLVIYLALEGGEDDGVLTFEIFTQEDIRNMQEMEKKSQH